MQLQRTQVSDPTHHEAEQITAAADRAASLTRQLLAFSRQQVMQPRCVDLNELLRSLDKMLRRMIGEDIEVMTALADGLGAVKVDPGQVDQVVMNLVVNARDAMPKGGKLTIETQNVRLDDQYAQKHNYVRAGDYVLLSVSDNGTGISPETQARMFEPFFTTKEAGKGTGLGLSMVYGIVKQSGGSIEVYSELNQGSTIKIYLPRVDEVAAERSAPVQAPPRSHGAEHILVVEDDALLRGLTAEILTAHGYVVHTVEKIADLRSCLERTPKCNLLLTDVVMPGMRGPELAARVVQHWPDIRVLYMSGYTSDAIVHHGVLDERLFFLQKPFTPAALVAKINEVLNTLVSAASSGSKT
jgi:two-component system cell cycle sensor histidine kinase/response regulator CckA